MDKMSQPIHFTQKSVITTTAPKIEALFTSAAVLLFHALFIVIQRRRSFLKAAVDFFFRRIDTSFGGYCNTKYIKVIIFFVPLTITINEYKWLGKIKYMEYIYAPLQSKIPTCSKPFCNFLMKWNICKYLSTYYILKS